MLMYSHYSSRSLIIRIQESRRSPPARHRHTCTPLARPPPPSCSTPKRWLGNCDYGFPAKVTNTAAPRRPKLSAASNATSFASSGPAAAPKGQGEAGRSSTRQSTAAKEEEGMMMMMMDLEAVFGEAARHLEAAEAGVGEARWQG